MHNDSGAHHDPYDGEHFWDPIEDQLPAFVEVHRTMLLSVLDGLTEDEARRSLVPSKTTLLGLVKHAAFVERVWFEEALTGANRVELGLPEDASESFDLTPDDTIASVTAALSHAVDQSREAARGLDLDATMPGNRRGPLPLRWMYLHVLRELAQHSGHADILREQILAARTTEA
ncbi:DinB family protein [Parenemella sanctibonifatiensis]|uniref:DinB family protein n=1 Tax=Parenemella sanctibonifatiensis TaxID=2016505 RepID=A0A255EC41_9ACTN|nr:DinB family protein [Parenemella sanctibonifatiensis]OYN89134.1 hypothetical protein CGZ91_12820 [Parenemella sanctibonifatiensis]